jgi:hypothetical protein
VGEAVGWRRIAMVIFTFPSAFSWGIFVVECSIHLGGAILLLFLMLILGYFY